MVFSSYETWSRITALVPQEHCKEALRGQGLVYSLHMTMCKNSSSSPSPPFVNPAGLTRVIKGKSGYVLREATIGKWWELGRVSQRQNSIHV